MVLNVSKQFMKPTTVETDNTPWYKIGMVWMMIGLPMTVVVASMITLVIAHRNAPIIISSAPVVTQANAAESVTD